MNMLQAKNLKGIYTALMTPFINGKIDEKALERHIHAQIQVGISGFVVCGTTGEGLGLTLSEQCLVTEICVSAVKGRATIFTGCSSPSTMFSHDLVSMAVRCGADGVMISPPPYVKPSEIGVEKHFLSIARQSSIPVMIYNIPSRTSFDMSNELIERIVLQSDNVIALKDCSGDLSRVPLLAKAFADSKREFVQFAGDDSNAIAYYAQGGSGLISVASNLVPEMVIGIYEACMANDFEKARELNTKIMMLNKLLFCESNPAPLKFAASLMRICRNELRLPLHAISSENERRIKETFESMGFVSLLTEESKIIL